jgi:hypothetical protein
MADRDAKAKFAIKALLIGAMLAVPTRRQWLGAGGGL